MPETIPTISDLDLVLRVIAATVLGGLIGFEREFSDQPAGFRTHILVCLGAALFTLAGAFGVGVFFAPRTTEVQFDPTRVAAQVVTGIGFLGAGAILRLGLNVQGLTTAAALWVTAAIGVAVALGYWVGAIATTLAALLSLWGLKRVERKVIRRFKRGRYQFTIDVDSELSFAHLARTVEERWGRVESMRIAEERERGRSTLICVLVLPPAIAPEIVAQELLRMDGVHDLNWG
jgi:putative Mg2+ transporter-C (MgtC) family protein